MMLVRTWSSHQQNRAEPLPRLWYSGRAPEMPTQCTSVLLAASKVKLALDQLRDQCRAALTGTRLLAFLVFLQRCMGAKLHRLSSLIVIPGSLQASFYFCHIVEGTNQTAAFWWSPTSGILGSPHKKHKNECFAFCLFVCFCEEINFFT